MRKKKKRAFKRILRFNTVSIDEMDHSPKNENKKNGKNHQVSLKIENENSRKQSSILKNSAEKQRINENAFYFKQLNRKETSRASRDIKTPFSSIQDLSNLLPNRFNSPNVVGRGISRDPSVTSRIIVPSKSPYILKGPDIPQKLKEKPDFRRQGSTRSIVGSNFNQANTIGNSTKSPYQVNRSKKN